jgi:gamma-glutamyltranspeptidase
MKWMILALRRSANMFGLEMKQTALPHKRMLSSMTPTIVEKNGKLL